MDSKIERITVSEYEQIRQSGEPHVLVDVRSPTNRHLAKLDNAVSVPIEQILTGDGCKQIESLLEKTECCSNNKKMIFAMCECGETSPKAVQALKDQLKNCCDLEIKDIIGGVEKYAEDIDPDLFVN